MTDKERLETIKELVKNIESILYDEWRQQELTILIESLYYADHVDWLINRVEELELEVNDWKDEVRKWQKFYEESEESHSETLELLHSTSSVVKRYRKALEEILNADWNSEGLDTERELDKVTDIAFKALEGEI